MPHRVRPSCHCTRRSGFSLLELLVASVIILLLLGKWVQVGAETEALCDFSRACEAPRMTCPRFEDPEDRLPSATVVAPPEASVKIGLGFVPDDPRKPPAVYRK